MYRFDSFRFLIGFRLVLPSIYFSISTEAILAACIPGARPQSPCLSKAKMVPCFQPVTWSWFAGNGRTTLLFGWCVPTRVDCLNPRSKGQAPMRKSQWRSTSKIAFAICMCWSLVSRGWQSMTIILCRMWKIWPRRNLPFHWLYKVWGWSSKPALIMSELDQKNLFRALYFTNWTNSKHWYNIYNICLIWKKKHIQDPRYFIYYKPVTLPHILGSKSCGTRWAWSRTRTRWSWTRGPASQCWVLSRWRPTRTWVHTTFDLKPGCVLWFVSNLTSIGSFWI